MGRKAAILPTNLALLQNLIKRDPASYKEEFKLQHQHYSAQRDIYLQNPRAARGHEEFAEFVGFISQVSACYPLETKEFSAEICQLLSEHYDSLHPLVAEKLTQSICMLRNKNILTNDVFISTIFPTLIATESKQLRTQCYSSLLQMVKNVNEPTRNQKINKMLQALLFNLLEDDESNGLWATKIIRELWRRGIWNDSRTVEIMAHGALSKDPKVASSAIRFFLGADKEREEAMAEDSDSDLDISSLKHKLNVNKKSSKRSRQIDILAKSAKKKINGPGKDATHLNFSAIHLLRDAQGFADKLYSAQLAANSGARLKISAKLDCVNLISRLVGSHKLIVLGIYSFLLRYLTPKQSDVTQFLAAAAQASHDLVPPDVLQPVVRKIADEFVSDGVAAEVAAAGLNSIREILARAPLAIDEPLLHDLVAYKGSKSKAVVMASRGLIQLFRDINPAMLPAKERGKSASIALRKGQNVDVIRYGETRSTGLDGFELLQKYKETNEEDTKDQDPWEIDSDASDESDSGWINVEDDDQDINISDSDDDKDDKNEATPDVDAAEKVHQFASSEILTPADFARLDQLKVEQGVRRALGQTNDEIVESISLTGSGKHKENKEERLARVHEGREDREKFGSHKRFHSEKDHSTTNKQKARKKNFIMMIHKRHVQGKAKQSLRDKQRILRAHIDRQKKGN